LGRSAVAAWLIRHSTPEVGVDPQRLMKSPGEGRED
jgi:hypothetical protein